MRLDVCLVEGGWMNWLCVDNERLLKKVANECNS